MDAGTLTDEQVEEIGLALMRLVEAVRDLAARFGVSPEELTLDLLPLARSTALTNSRSLLASARTNRLTPHPERTSSSSRDRVFLSGSRCGIATATLQGER